VNLLGFAKKYLEQGLSVIPLKYKDKAPLIPWKEYQERKPTIEEIEKWFGDNKPKNIGIVCGKVSGNLVVLDFDNKEELSKFIVELPRGVYEKIEKTMRVETGKGYHIYLRLPENMNIRTIPRVKDGVDIKGEGGYVVAPPSIHPSGKTYQLKTPIEIVELTPSDWLKILDILGAKKEVKKQGEENKKVEGLVGSDLRNLNDSDIVKIKELLKDAYREDFRQFIWLFLSGWGAKARVNPISIVKILKMLYDETQDKDQLKMRLSAVVYSYKKAGVWNQEIEEMIKNQFSEWGINRVSGLESLINEDNIKGKSGLQEILEQTIGEEKALETIRQIEEILGVASPFYDSIFEILDYEKQIYAVANLRKKLMVRAQKRPEGIVYKEAIAPVCPTKIVMYQNPLGGITKYEITFEGKERKKLVVGPAIIDDIIARLKIEGGMVKNKRYFDDVLNAIIHGFLKKKRIEIKEEIESPGFYLVDGEIRPVKIDVKETNKQELFEALELLEELSKRFEHAIDRFSTAIKWGLIAPFSYIYKQKHNWIPWLYLFGASGTGKTTIGEIILSIWGLGPDHIKTGASIDTVPRLGHILGQSTFPFLINEPGNALGREDVIEAIKNAIEKPVARGRFIRGSYTEIPSLAPIIMTSNKHLPRDDALRRRLIVLIFTYGEKIDKEKAIEFEKQVKPRLGKLSPLGLWAAKRIIENPKLLENDWRTIGKILLEQAYKEVGKEPPEWITIEYNIEDTLGEDLLESIRTHLVKRINEEYTRFVGKVMINKIEDGTSGQTIEARSEIPFDDRVRTVLENNLLPWAILKGDEVIITSGIMNDISSIIGDIGGIKSLAELLGWEYKAKHSMKIGGKVINRSVIMTSLENFLKFLKI